MASKTQTGRMDRRFFDNEAGQSLGKLFSLVMIIGLVTMGIMAMLIPNEVGADENTDIQPILKYDMGSDVRTSTISADSNYIAVCAGAKLNLFSKDDATPLWTFTETGGIDISESAISGDGEYIVIGTNNDKLHLFNKDSSTPLWTYTAGDYMRTVSITPDGKYIVAGSKDNKVYLFERDSSTPLWSYNIGEATRSVKISGSGEYIAAGGGGSSNKIFLFDRAFTGSEPLWSYSTGDNVWTIDISFDGEYIVAGNGQNEGKIFVFDKDSSTPLWTKTFGKQTRVSMSDDGSYIFAGGYDENVYFFDRANSNPLWSYTLNEAVEFLALSGDGEYAVAGSLDHSAYFFDQEFTNSAPLWSYETEDQVYRYLSISSKGDYIAIPSKDGNFYLFQNDNLIISSENSYYPEETVTVAGSYNNGTTNITFQVDDPNDETYIVKTLETDEYGQIDFKFNLGEDTEFGEWTVYATNSKDSGTDTITFMVEEPPFVPHIIITQLDVPDSVARGDTVEVGITIENTFDAEKPITLVLQLEDPNLVPIPPKTQEQTLAASTIETYTLSILIPVDAKIGTYAVQGQMLTGLPKSAGYALDFGNDNIEVT